MHRVTRSLARTLHTHPAQLQLLENRSHTHAQQGMLTNASFSVYLGSNS